MLLLLGTSVLVLASEQTSLCTRAALCLLSIFGFRIRAVLAAFTLVTFLVTHVLMSDATTLVLIAIVEATMFELQHDVISNSFAKALLERRHVKTTVDDDYMMTAVSVKFISPRSTVLLAPMADDVFYHGDIQVRVTTPFELDSSLHPMMSPQNVMREGKWFSSE